MTRILPLLFAILAACSGPETNAPPSAPPPAETVKVAGNLPLSGPIASFSGGYPKGFDMGLEWARSSAGLPSGAFATDFQDNAGSPQTALTVLQRQLTDDPKVYVSGTTQMTEPLLPELNKRPLLHFLVSFDAFMTKESPNVFRILPNFKIEAPLFLKYLQSQQAKKVFFFTPNLKAYLEQSDKLILPGLGEGVQHERELFEFGQTDFRPLALKAKDSAPDVIVVSGYSFHVLPILRALRELGLVEKTKVLVTLDFIDLLHNGTPAADLAGVTFVAPECEIPGRVAGFAEWRAAFKHKYGQDASYVDAYAYDTARVLASAYKKGGKVDEASVRSVLPFDGVVGRIELDADRDLQSTLTLGTVDAAGVVTEVK